MVFIFRYPFMLQKIGSRWRFMGPLPAADMEHRRVFAGTFIKHERREERRESETPRGSDGCLSRTIRKRAERGR